MKLEKQKKKHIFTRFVKYFQSSFLCKLFFFSIFVSPRPLIYLQNFHYVRLDWFIWTWKIFLPTIWYPLMLSLNPKKADELTKKQRKSKNAHKLKAAESVKIVVSDKTMRLRNDFNRSHRLSRQLEYVEGPPHASSRLNDFLPNDKKTFPKHSLDKFSFFVRCF